MFEHRKAIGFKSMLFILSISKMTVPVGFRFTEISTKTIKFSLSVAKVTKNQQSQIFRSPIFVICSIPKKFKPVVAFFSSIFCDFVYLPSKIKNASASCTYYYHAHQLRLSFNFRLGMKKKLTPPENYSRKKTQYNCFRKKTLKPKS